MCIREQYNKYQAGHFARTAMQYSDQPACTVSHSVILSSFLRILNREDTDKTERKKMAITSSLKAYFLLTKLNLKVLVHF